MKCKIEISGKNIMNIFHEHEELIQSMLEYAVDGQLSNDKFTYVGEDLIELSIRELASLTIKKEDFTEYLFAFFDAIDSMYLDTAESKELNVMENKIIRNYKINKLTTHMKLEAVDLTDGDVSEDILINDVIHNDTIDIYPYLDAFEEEKYDELISYDEEEEINKFLKNHIDDIKKEHENLLRKYDYQYCIWLLFESNNDETTYEMAGSYGNEDYIYSDFSEMIQDDKEEKINSLCKADDEESDNKEKITNINTDIIIEDISSSLCLDRDKVATTVKTVFDYIINQATSGKKVSIDGFGTFEVIESLPRIVTNPRTGETIHVGFSRVLKFRADENLVDCLKHMKK